MLNMKKMKAKNTWDELWLKKIYGEWKGIKEDEITNILIPDESSSDSVSSKYENDDKMEQKESQAQFLKSPHPATENPTIQVTLVMLPIAPAPSSRNSQLMI